MKLVLVLMAMLWTECIAVTDLGLCDDVSNDQVCGEVTEDPNGCSTDADFGTKSYFWTCPRTEDIESIKYKCYRRCIEKMVQPAECVGIERRCNIHELYGTCEPFSGNCDLGSRDITWDCGDSELVICPVLCCCTGCPPSGSLIPDPMVCVDDRITDIACLESCPTGMTRRLENMEGCFKIDTIGRKYGDAQTDCASYVKGAQVGHVVELLNDDYATLIPLYTRDNHKVWLGSRRDNGIQRWFVDGRLVRDTAESYWTGQGSGRCITFELNHMMKNRHCINERRSICELSPWW